MSAGRVAGTGSGMRVAFTPLRLLTSSACGVELDVTTRVRAELHRDWVELLKLRANKTIVTGPEADG